MVNQKKKQDHWSSEQYQAAASFVPQLTNKVVQLLDVKPHDRILDIGCGDGALTNALARSCKLVTGYDSSQSMIETAQWEASQNLVTNVSYEVVDCSQLGAHSKFETAAYDKVFSNAALHWILRQTSTRDTVFKDVYQALKPGGRFVFECGGAGNVAEVVTALLAALTSEAGLSHAVATQLVPWYFASEDWARAKLKEARFDVELVELEYRPTVLNQGQGVEGWIRLFGASMLGHLQDESIKDAVVKRAAELVRWSTTREEGEQVIGYVRLRAVAVKPS